QAGTLSGNPLAMAAGIATLKKLKADRKKIYADLERKSALVANGVAAAAKDADTSVSVNRMGSMFTWFFTNKPVHDWDTAAKCDTAAFGSFHRGMLEAGVYMPPSQFEAAFLSAAHTEEDIQKTITAAKTALATMKGKSTVA